MVARLGFREAAGDRKSKGHWRESRERKVGLQAKRRGKARKLL
jgi:hypothetical protein